MKLTNTGLAKRALCVMLALFTAISLTGCIRIDLAKLVESALPSPTAALKPSASATPTETDSAAAAENEAALKALDEEMFASSVSSDALSFHLTVEHPESFPEITDVPSGWGEFTYEQACADNESSIAYLERLKVIDRDMLCDDSKITYDTLLQFLEMSIEEHEYYYYNEVLDTLVGFHSNLPLNLVFYDMHSAQDVEAYLTLLEDTPRYISQVLAFEEEKSAAGKFMRDNALDTVLSQIQDFIDSRETCFLLGTFDEAIEKIDSLTDAERAAYSERNKELVNALIDSYAVLFEGLDALRSTATNDGGLSEYGEEGKAFFAAELKYNACSDLTPKEALNVLYDELDAQVERLYKALVEDQSVYERFDTLELSVGTTEDNIDYLTELMAEYYPELPEHTLTFMDCPSELEDQFSPAAYLIPSVDNPSENLIILNQKTLGDDTRYLDTLAHEGYPGHLYHYQYIRTLIDKTGYTRQAMSLGGYYEAWSQSAEVFFDTYNSEFGYAYCTFMSANTTISSLILPAIASIEVNYYGKSASDLEELVATYFGDESAAELAELYYQYAVENPFYFLEYAMGFSIYQQKLREAEELCRDNFDLRSFHETYLNIGPTYFNISMPIMDDWISANK